MKREIIASEIRNLTEVIREQQEHLLTYGDRIPQIEIDLLMGNVRKLYESLHLLNKMNGEIKPLIAPKQNLHHTDELIANIETSHTVAPAVAATVIEPEKPSTHIQPEALLVKAEETGIVTETEEPKSEEIASRASVSQERAKEFTRTAPATLFDEAPVTVSSKFQGTPSLYDKITSSKEDKSIATRSQTKPVSDLKKSIGINEKFSFINELFDGDLNAYNEAIEKLNSSQNHESAVSLLNNELATKFGWDNSGESLEKLRTLVDRRFSA